MITRSEFIENIKEHQSEALQEGSLFNMGQYLSIPFIALGIFLIARSMRKVPAQLAENVEEENITEEEK